MNSLPEKKSFEFDLIDVNYLVEDYKSAKAVLNAELRKNPRDLELKTYLAYIEAAMGNTAAAEEIFSEIKDTLVFWRRHEFEYQIDYLKARMFALSGNREGAIDLLKRALAKGQFYHHWDFDRDVFLKNIFNEPSFQSVVRPLENKSITGLP